MTRTDRGRTNRVVALGLALLAATAGAQTITLNEAWGRIQARNPELAGAASGVRSAEASLTQARLIPNPELEVMTEEYGRSEVEVGLSLPLEVGGQRRSRIRVARAELDVARFDSTMTGHRLKAEMLRRFASALALKLKVEISDTLLELVRSSAAHIARRVDAGAAAELDLLREQTELTSLQVESWGLGRNYRAACRSLAALWQAAAAAEPEPGGSFIGRPELPDMEMVQATISDCPDVLCCKAEVELARAEIEAARSEGFPELVLAGGARRNNEVRENAVMLGVSMSLPVFDRNQGAIMAARHAAKVAEQSAIRKQREREAAGDRILTDIAVLSERIDTGYAVILPAHRRVLNTLASHYDRGAVGILELIGAQREFHETLIGLIDAQAERASLAADLLETTSYELAVVKE